VCPGKNGTPGGGVCYISIKFKKASKKYLRFAMTFFFVDVAIAHVACMHTLLHEQQLTLPVAPSAAFVPPAA